MLFYLVEPSNSDCLFSLNLRLINNTHGTHKNYGDTLNNLKSKKTYARDAIYDT